MSSLILPLAAYFLACFATYLAVSIVISFFRSIGRKREAGFSAAAKLSAKNALCATLLFALLGLVLFPLLLPRVATAEANSVIGSIILIVLLGIFGIFGFAILSALAFLVKTIVDSWKLG
ncbi:MAG: hypothetical protein V1820_02530 [archaeon]